MSKRKWLALAVLVAALIGAQLVPIDRTNPVSPASDSISAVSTLPSEARTTLERACFDCHSNQTSWPWYSRLAPASWLIADDVHSARSYMNFSEWGRYDQSEKAHLLLLAARLVRAGDMPPLRYRLLHPAARLSSADVDRLARELKEQRSILLETPR
jgi:hypothetical protein